MNIAALLAIFFMKFYTMLNIEMYTSPPSYVEIYLKVAKLCCFNVALSSVSQAALVTEILRGFSEDSSFLLLLAYQRIRGFAFMRYINPLLID